MKILSFAVLACLWAAPAAAAEIQVYSAGAVEPGLLQAIPAWTRETGHVARLTVAVPAALRQRIEAGEAPDVLIAPPAVVDPLIASGKVTADGRARVGRAAVGVVVRTGAPVPDISSTEYWTTRDRTANVRLYRLAAEILGAVEASVFPPRVGWQCGDCPVRSRCWAWG